MTKKQTIIEQLNQGLNVNEIALNVGCNTSYIYRIMRTINIQPEKNRKQNDVIKMLEETDHSIFTISQLLNVSESFIRKINASAGYKYRQMGKSLY